MRKIIVLLGIFLFFPSITWAQEKVEAPVWNVGDKWVFTQGNIEVVGSDQNSYILNHIFYIQPNFIQWFLPFL